MPATPTCGYRYCKYLDTVDTVDIQTYRAGVGGLLADRHLSADAAAELCHAHHGAPRPLPRPQLRPRPGNCNVNIVNIATGLLSITSSTLLFLAQLYINNQGKCCAIALCTSRLVESVRGSQRSYSGW